MTRKIGIKTESTGDIPAEIIDEKNPKTAEAIWKALPIRARANRWGDEIYFSIPVSLGEEEAQEEVKVGDLAYWPPGKGFCIFFGPTPASVGAEPRAASPVNVFGRIVGDASIFRKVRSGEKIEIQRAE